MIVRDEERDEDLYHQGWIDAFDRAVMLVNDLAPTDAFAANIVALVRDYLSGASKAETLLAIDELVAEERVSFAEAPENV